MRALILNLLIVICAFAELREMEYEEVPTRVIPDGSYSGKSLLIVESTIPQLKFESTRGIAPGSVKEKESGIWWVTLKPGVQLISINADGYLPLKEFRHNFVNRQAWAIKITTKSLNMSDIPILIQVVPPDARVLIDGKIANITSSIKLKEGEHSIKLSKDGYITYKDRFIVSEDNVIIEFTLEKRKLGSMKFVKIPSGAFTMGSPYSEIGRRDVEEPQLHVTVESFYIMSTEVTQEQWKMVMGTNPSRFKGKYRPVENVSWIDVQQFINKLNQIDPGKGYRLPSEAEWEYACRAGSITRFPWGDDPSNKKLNEYAWYKENSETANVNATSNVGLKKGNRWGLHDMQGNVWEWCEDLFYSSYRGYPIDGRSRTTGMAQNRVYRGGSCFSDAKWCRPACRAGLSPSSRENYIGFRLVKKY